MGIVEGITEWLPISSTGHMILLDEFIQLQMSDAFKSMFEVVIQLGAILAVVLLYFSKLWPFKMPKKGEGFDWMAKQIAAHAEVKGVYLMSGGYDLAVFVECASLKKVARFVSERISTFEGVLSTATHFILKKYKIEGALTERADTDNRLSVQP